MPSLYEISLISPWPLDKMAAISQNEFSWMKMLEIQFSFHWNLFLIVQLSPVWRHAITWASADPVHCHRYAALGGDELILARKHVLYQNSTNWFVLSYKQSCAAVVVWWICGRHITSSWRPDMELISTLLSRMMTSSNGNIFHVTATLWGEFTSLHPNIRLSKQSRSWWFETPLRSLWRHCNGIAVVGYLPVMVVPLVMGQ